MVDFLALFRSNAGNLKARLRDLGASIEQLRQRREELLTLPLPAADVMAILDRVLDRRAAAFEGNFLRRLSYFAGQPDLDPESQGALSVVLAVDASMSVITPGLFDQALAYFCKDQFLEKCSDGLTKIGTNSGPSRAVRERELADIELKLADLEGQATQAKAELDEMRSELT